jgi:hypothetical protein
MSASVNDGLRRRNREQPTTHNLPKGFKRVLVGFKVMLQGPKGLVPDDGLPVEAYGSASDQPGIAAT